MLGLWNFSQVYNADRQICDHRREVHYQVRMPQHVSDATKNSQDPPRDHGAIVDVVRLRLCEQARAGGGIRGVRRWQNRDNAEHERT